MDVVRKLVRAVGLAMALLTVGVVGHGVLQAGAEQTPAAQVPVVTVVSNAR